MLMIKQPIAGVSPPSKSEVTVMTVFPTLGASGAGRMIGRLCSLQVGVGFFTLGKLLAVLMIPVALPLFALSLLPGVLTRYRVTNRRVIVQKGLSAVDQRWVDLDRFDAIEVEVLPGHAWYRAGDLIFRNGQIETFRLAGVPTPQAFRLTCLAAHRGYLSTLGR
jgi:hypothetical protein